ncbi:MAG: HAMP domain-containing histidine kinase [Gemmatimonadota bacterium]|nr:HAMP domain-containing histidine kinase [Gemmatimonadota bacterium]
MKLSHALVLLMMSVLVVGIVPAGLLLERRLGVALVDGVRQELNSAPMILEDRLASERVMRMMHARDYAAMPGLAQALQARDMPGASRMLTAASQEVLERPILVQPDGRTVLGPGAMPQDLLDATRRGEMPVSVVPFQDGLHLVALAPVGQGNGWLGAVGGSTPFAEAEAVELAALTRSGVVVLDARGNVTASTVDDEVAAVAARAAGATPGTVEEILGPREARLLVTAAPLDYGRVIFIRDLEQELAVLPDLERTALVSTAGAFLFALLVGALFAHRLSRPVSELADASEGFAEGRAEVPLQSSSLIEVQRLSEAFAAMRETLAARLSDLEHANSELEDRQARLVALQAEVVHRERLATSGRLLAQLAHEIRNPVASVRNCLEVVRRQGNLQGEAREFADMAVSELLRMHELAEGMLDLHRPRPEQESGPCDAGEVAGETVQLLSAGSSHRDQIGLAVSGDLAVRMPREALKQVLLNLLLNAREAGGSEGSIEIVASRDEALGQVRIDVLDRGTGVPDEIADRIFDPFFTTKEAVHGVGLGLYTAESLVRAAGGALEAANRTDAPGTRFTVILPAAA